MHIRDLFVSYYNYRFIILLGDYHSDNKHQRNLLACDSILKKRPATTAYMDGSYRRVPGGTLDTLCISTNTNAFCPKT